MWKGTISCSDVSLISSLPSQRESVPAFTLQLIHWSICSSVFNRWLVKLTLVLQILNTMNLIWAFDFDLARNPETKEQIPVDIWNFEQVCLPLRIWHPLYFF
jgi:hypothetical protein